MTIIYDSCEKTSQPRSFGRGILASRPVHRLPVSVADMEWAEQHLNGDGPIDWEAMFAAVTAQELMDAGYAPF